MNGDTAASISKVLGSSKSVAKADAEAAHASFGDIMWAFDMCSKQAGKLLLIVEVEPSSTRNVKQRAEALRFQSASLHCASVRAVSYCQRASTGVAGGAYGRN